MTADGSRLQGRCQPGELRARREAIGVSAYVMGMGMGLSHDQVTTLEEGRASDSRQDQYARCLERLERLAADRLAAELFTARQGRRFAS
jgi:hypothetical protein